ncbi:cupin domain-containing protein [Muricomes intestini]|jgi:quercetin dioxygenase-like cupin family protein|uniref:Cupin domain n=1 Tax=Muricomes intestini TaxID=1796634 RepID=A0A4R3K2W1_9FIRM|nr:cupin domain-containing protein [Muricomes intestini]TCS76729.1 cupin domain [Muricomes intestini]HAX51741.1 cupin domain-containing protein [Lachnospiraceae bacterium]HCR82230.1 cupin domain-containing protein [Lachnospiraceae bacterium]
MTKAGERKVETVERANGGAGFIMKEALLTPEQLGSHCGMFSQVTLKPNCELGYHEHHGETETYYILSGRGMYDDDGKAVPIGAGDVLFCEDGKGHGAKNTGNEDLVFVALILKTK